MVRRQGMTIMHFLMDWFDLIVLAVAIYFAYGMHNCCSEINELKDWMHNLDARVGETRPDRGEQRSPSATPMAR